MTDYGTDIAMTADLRGVDPTFASVSGRRCLSEALARRLQTRPGELIDDPDYGYDLIDELNDDLGPADVGRIVAQSALECKKDERVLDCTGSGSFVGGVLTVALGVTDGAGPFPLVLAVSSVGVTILKVGA